MNGNLYIPKPCHENWNKMTPDEKGRHCAVCSKVVTDFTKMNTEEIITSLQESTGEVCGHIKIDQLTATNKRQKVYFWIKGTLIPKIGYAAFAIIGLASVFKRSAFAQSMDGQIIANGGLKYQPQENQQKQVNIEVVDESNQPVSGALVTISAGKVNLSNGSTNKDGVITSTIEMQELGYTFINIEVNAPGYRSKLVKDVRINKSGLTFKIKLDEEIIIMGKMIHYEEPIVNPIKIAPVIIGDAVIENETKIELFNTHFLSEDNEMPNESSDTTETLDTKYFNSWLDTDPEALSFVSFPNPTQGNVTIETKQEASFDVKIYNELGVLVIQQNDQFKRSSISLTGNPAGTYFAILFINNKAIETHKIILIK